jgi:Ca2+-transporting ATPase
MTEPATVRDAPPDAGTSADDWHSRSGEEVLSALDSSADGLSASTAQERLESYGANEIRRGEAVSPVEIFVAQFQDFLIYLLFLAALLSILVGFLPGAEPNYVDAGLIFAILVANGVFGFVQDYRAEKSMEALRELSSPDATVLRDGEKRTVDSTALVPGDVIFLEQGDAVPADARLLSVTNLQTNEAALTGESASVAKTDEPLAADAPLAERENMVFMNTTVVRGRGQAVVVETGMETEVGSIATQIQAAEEEKTPFQEEVDDLGRRIGFGILALIVLIAITQFTVTRAAPIAIFLTAVTLAVAAVPEGLPAVVTLTLAMGSRKMLRRNALVRRLPVVESLGSVDVIVTDKTGTLTESTMTVTRLYYEGDRFDVSGSGLEPDGEFSRDGDPVDAANLDPLLRCGALCNNAEPAPDDADREYYGDPTEVAVLVSAAKAGIEPSDDRRHEIPFSSDRRRMTVVVGEDDGPTAYMKGAPEVVLEHCDRIRTADGVAELTDERREAVLDATHAFADDALRVLGFAMKEEADPDAAEDDLESGMVFLGLQGMIDPPRAEVSGAVGDCRDAGIRVVMVTGDNIATAKAVGAEVGFDPEGAMTGAEVEELSAAELSDRVEEVEIFARVAPDHKVRILEALQDNGHDVAMTGDGVNDAPALRNADVGISMGVRGTDVAKEASDMVLQDDNFVTIRDAIAEGRGIFDNIRKFVNYLLSANAGEVLVVFLGVLLGTALFPELFAGAGGEAVEGAEALVLTPVMLLWINMVTDGLPALALGVDPKADNIMDRPPRPADESVIDRRMLASILAIGLVMTATGLAVFFYTLQATGRLVLAQSVLFTFLVTVEMVRIQLIRGRYDQSLRSNRWLIGAIAASLALQLAVLYTPIAGLFDVVGPGLWSWGVIGVGFAAFLALGSLAERLLDRTVDDSL